MEIIKEEKEELTFAFDLGTGSIGECIRQSKEVKHFRCFDFYNQTLPVLKREQ